MTDTTISFRVDNEIHRKMKMHDEINWSAVIRKIISDKLEHLDIIDRERAMNAAKNMDTLRKKKVFDKGKTSKVIIREWRDKRR